MTDPSRSRRPLRLLVLAPNWLGDVVMTTPLLSCLHANRDPVGVAAGRPLEIHLGIRSVWSGLFRDDPRVDELLILERGGRQAGFPGALRLAKILKRGRYDAVLLGPPSLRTGLAVWLARIPCRVGYRADGRSLLLTHGLGAPPRGNVHYSQEMIRLGSVWLDTLGVSEPRLPGTPGASSLPGCDSVAPAGSGSGRPVWAVAPGTTYGEAKTWPASRLAEFSRRAIGEAGVRLVFLGDAAAREFTALLKRELPRGWSEDLAGDEDLVDLTGKTDLLAAVGVLKACRAFVGNDSGLMHLAAALGIPTVGIFGSSNPDWTAPLGARTRAVFPDGFACRPCYRKTCNQPTFCLDMVPADMVLTAVAEITNNEPSLPGGV